MRWLWIDRFDEFVRGDHAVAIKAVSLTEEYLQGHCRGVPIVPNSLVLEGLAQAAGILVADTINYSRLVVLAKVLDAEFDFDVMPGDVLRFRVEIAELSENGSLVTATSTVGKSIQSTATIMFGHLVMGEAIPSPFTKEEVRAWLHVLGIARGAIDVKDLCRPNLASF
jgi:3-hydroxyacyl-[acyl-carrier-protein] dehydratase